MNTLLFPAVQAVLNEDASASGTFDKVAENYSQVTSRPEQAWEQVL